MRASDSIKQMERSDSQLMCEYNNGDIAAFVVLVNRYTAHLANFAYRLCGNKSDAEEIVQETFVKVWKSSKKYKPEHNFKSWLFAIARNTAIDYMRKKKMAVFSDFENE